MAEWNQGVKERKESGPGELAWRRASEGLGRVLDPESDGMREGGLEGKSCRPL